MTVIELIEKLNDLKGDARVLATWEGTVQELSVYVAKDGTVMIDADQEVYRKDFESGRLKGLTCDDYMDEHNRGKQPNE